METVGKRRRKRRSKASIRPVVAPRMPEALVLLPGRPVPPPVPHIDPTRLVSWRRFLPLAPLFLAVVMIDAILEVPPVVQWRGALHRATELFFGDGAVPPWEGLGV
jgi:hypothetical protein